MNAISDDFKNAALSAVLPAFTLSVDKPLVLIFKVCVDDANNLPLHLFKFEGSEVGGSSLRFVKYSSAPDTSEDEDAMLYDGTGRTETLSSNVIYVAAVFGNNSYAPILITGTEKDNSHSLPVLPRSSHSGCNSGCLCLTIFLLPVLMRKRSSPAKNN